jgi:transposase-like protein
MGKIFKSLRNVCTISLDKINLKLGGRNQTIQIDESLFAKVKHFVGKDLVRKQVWVFGMVDVKPDQIYFECVKDRTAQTLLSVINDHVLPGSSINSDCYASYNKINLLHEESIQHNTVNHTYNFVDPDSSTHTNKIESLWCVGKTRFKEMRGCSRLYIQSYLDEFMWRHNNKLSRHDAFKKILRDIVKVYDNFSNTLIELNVESINGPDILLGEIINDVYDEDVLSTAENELDVSLFHFFEPSSVNQSVLTNKSLFDQSKVVDQSKVDDQVVDPSKVSYECEKFSIEYQSTVELKHKFVLLVQNLNNQCIIISNLNKSGRKILHVECDSLKLFHWSKKINEK